MHQLDKNNILGDILGMDPTDVVVVTYAMWTEVRHVMTKDGEIKFRQARETDGEWLLIDFIKPVTDEWPFVTRNALALGQAVPYAVWMGPVNSIPDYILHGSQPFMLRVVDDPGWFNLRGMAEARCEAQA